MINKCPNCNSHSTELQVTINRKPERETNFDFSPYQRYIHFCLNCHIFYSDHYYDFDKDFYNGNYNNSTYKNKLSNTYDKIMALSHTKSDNYLRCERVHSKLSNLNFKPHQTNILDVGSGLCVFLGKMKEYGYKGYAVDPDPLSIEHALSYVGLEGAYCGPVHDCTLDINFDLISLNKVLEHVKNPLNLLKDSLLKLKSGGLCYIELPDGDTASQQGGFINREEFFIEHYYIYTENSMKQLMSDCGLKNITIEAIHEPSDKYSLVGFGVKP